MASTLKVFTTLLLLTYPLQTLQVDIALDWWREGIDYFDNLVTARWNNVAPGTCCKPGPELLSQPGAYHAGETRFIGLLPNQFGAGWAANGVAHSDIINCTGAPLLRVFGTSTNPEHTTVAYNPPWDEDIPGTPETVVFAAAWIDLRLRFPPNSAGTRYLRWQGVTRAVWGKDTWNANSDGIPFPKRKRSGGGSLRLNGYAQQGTAYVSTPTRWAYPVLYTVNGTDYTDNGNRSYVSADGRVLDFKTFARR